MTKRTVTAMFDTQDEAIDAKNHLAELGVPFGNISMSSDGGDRMPRVATTGAAGGLLGFLGEFFAGSDDHDLYAEGLRRGGFLVAAEVDESRHDAAVAALAEHGSVDLDERQTDWLVDGWQRRSALKGAATGIAATSFAPERSTAKISSDAVARIAGDAAVPGSLTWPRSGRPEDRIHADMQVVGSDGRHVGTVDGVAGANIKLKRNDSTSHGQHHLIPLNWVISVDNEVTLNMEAFDAMQRWQAA